MTHPVNDLTDAPDAEFEAMLRRVDAAASEPESAGVFVAGPICGRIMFGGPRRCGLPHLHRERCAPERKLDTCALCDRPIPCDVHEGCYSLGFDSHQDMVTVTTVDYLGRTTTHKCRRCGAGFGTMFVPLAMLGGVR